MKANRTEIELTRQNIVLANFMELDMVYDSLNKMMTWTDLETGCSYFTDELRYHKNSERLSTVCRNIEREGAEILVRPNDSNGFECKIIVSDNRICFGANVDVHEAIFEACVYYVEAVHEHDYPYNEGDEYYYKAQWGTIYHGVWDTESCVFHQEFQPEYFTEEEVLQLVREDGLKTKSATPNCPTQAYPKKCNKCKCK